MLHSLFKSMSLVMFMRVGGIALQLLWFVILVRLLPLEAVGVYSVINSIWILTRALGPCGYATGFMREGSTLVSKQKFPKALGYLSFGIRQAFWFNSAFYIFIAIGAYLLRDSIPFISYTTVLWALLAGYAYLLFGFYSSAMLAMEKQISAHALESIILPVSVMLAMVTLHLYEQLTLEHLILTQVAIAITIALIYRFITVKSYGIKITKLTPKQQTNFTALARRLFGTIAFNNLNVRLPVVLSPFLIGIAGTALLEAALRFASLLGVIQWCAAFVIAPKLSKVDTKKEPDTLQELLVMGCWMVFIPACILFLILLFGGDILLNLIAGSEYMDAYIPLVILAFGYLINTSSGPTTHFYMMLGHEKTALKISASETIITMVLLVTLSQWLGIYGMAMGMTLGLIFRNFWLNQKLQKLTKLYSGVWSIKGWKHLFKLVREHA
ncbi:MAG: polysaccharide biosynthesis C-terminal domain-containing protein [Rickettsiales bacterium]|nr:polysaccharide biosynthesis C-terminal domain-containing protein [Rickettsiales bacterium]